MCDLVFSIQEFLKIVPGLFIFPLSFYLAWKKIGIKVSSSFSVHHERTLPPRIGAIMLTNQKDKPVTIFSIHAMIGKSIFYEVDHFDPPMILKPLESLQLTPKPYSNLYLGADRYKPDFGSADNVELYIAIPNKIIRCQNMPHPSPLLFCKFNSYRMAIKSTLQFNGLVYNENAMYAITYRMDSAISTAIVDTSGLICREWNYHVNVIPQQYMKSKMEVRKYLELIEFDKAAGWFAVDELIYGKNVKQLSVDA